MSAILLLGNNKMGERKAKKPLILTFRWWVQIKDSQFQIQLDIVSRLWHQLSHLILLAMVLRLPLRRCDSFRTSEYEYIDISGIHCWLIVNRGNPVHKTGLTFHLTTQSKFSVLQRKVKANFNLMNAVVQWFIYIPQFKNHSLSQTLLSSGSISFKLGLLPLVKNHVKKYIKNNFYKWFCNGNITKEHLINFTFQREGKKNYIDIHKSIKFP